MKTVPALFIAAITGFLQPLAAALTQIPHVGETERSPSSMTEIAHAAQVLARAGIAVDADTTGKLRWGPKPAEQHLVEVQVLASIEGFDPADLTG